MDFLSAEMEVPPYVIASLAGAAVLGVARFAFTQTIEYLRPKPPVPETDDRIVYMEEHSSMIEVRGKWLRIVRVVHESPEAPTIFFFHGAGGQAQQWKEQVDFFRGRSNMVCLDLPGHGASDKPRDRGIYAYDSLVADCVEVFNRYKSACNIVMAHSYGTAIALGAYPAIRDDVKALVLLSLTIDSGHKPHVSPKILSLPDDVLNLLRTLDRRGGINSVSVRRMLSPHARDELKQRQLVWNAHTPTHVVKALSSQIRRPSESHFAALACPVLMISGADDVLTPPDNILKAHAVLPAGAHQPYVVPECGHQPMLERRELVNALANRFLIEVAGIDALSRLHRLNRGDSMDAKWSVKNFEKWRRLDSFGRPVGRKGFIPMKVPRQDDPDHSPVAFLERHPSVSLIVDVSSDIPPYLPIGWPAHRGRPVRYTKLATVSKIVPTIENVHEFIRVVEAQWNTDEGRESHVAVHCHYGYNRTGFFIVSHLVEVDGMGVAEAIAAFAAARPPGIRHQHFIDELYLRYSTVRDISRETSMESAPVAESASPSLSRRKARFAEPLEAS